MGGIAERASRILNRDGLVRQTFHQHTDGSFTIRTYQDAQKHVDAAHRLRREDAEGRTSFGKRADFMRRTMIVPQNVMMQIAQKLGIAPKDIFGREQQDRIWKELKSGDYKMLRTVTDKRL